jgi:MoxR-like ATPase
MSEPDPQALERGPRLVREVLSPMKQTFVGKDEVIDLLGVCLAAGENLFLLGPPGTAKSALVHDLGRRLDGPTFDYLLTRFSEPNELFGPFDIRRLREGELVTNTEGMLPEAALVFLDELLNANSAILNSLLMVLNERVFRRGRETRPLPCLMIVGASNHLPEDAALGALFDRFLLRVRCDNVADERLAEVLDAGWRLDLGLNQASPTVAIDDIRALQACLASVDLSGVRAPYVKLIARLRAAGISVSDRRAVKLQRLIAASALLCGRAQAMPSDLWVVRHTWDSEEQIEVLAAQVDAALQHTEPSPRDHPRAGTGGEPDAEGLARDLESLEERLGQQPAPDERARLRDRLGALAGRCQWVANETQRGALLERVERLWPQLAG